MSLLAMEGKRSQNPDPFKPKRVGHPEKPNQFLRVDVLEWYHLKVIRRQEEHWGRVGHPEKLRQLLGVDVLEWYHSIVRIR